MTKVDSIDETEEEEEEEEEQEEDGDNVNNEEEGGKEDEGSFKGKKKGPIEQLKRGYTMENIFENLSTHSTQSADEKDDNRSINTKDPFDDNSTLGSSFHSDIAETMALLREVCNPTYKQLSTVKLVLSAIKTICKDRFEAKKRLGQSAAAEHLLQILLHYRTDLTLLQLSLEAINEFMLNENDNKIFMGAVGLINEIPTIFQSIPSHQPHLIQLLLQLITLSCHNKIKGLLVKYCKPKHAPVNYESVAPPTTLYPDYLSIDNRQKLGEVGICQKIMEILNPFTFYDLHSTHIITEIEDPEDLMIWCAKAISTLSTNDDNARRFGEHQACEAITKLIAHTKNDMDRCVHFLWALIILCSDAENDNRIKFGNAGICKAIVDRLHDIQKLPSFYSKNPLFTKYMEYLAWSLTNLIRDCRLNRNNIRKITYAEVVIGNVLSIPVIPRGAKIKLNQVYIDIYEKDLIIVEQSNIDSVHSNGSVDKDRENIQRFSTDSNDSDEQKTYLTQPHTLEAK